MFEKIIKIRKLLKCLFLVLVKIIICKFRSLDMLNILILNLKYMKYLLYIKDVDFENFV